MSYRPVYPQPEIYQFPATHHVSNSPWRQWFHLMSEVIEIALALLVGNIQQAAVKTWYVKRSMEIFHRILSGRGADIELAREEIEGNDSELKYHEQ